MVPKTTESGAKQTRVQQNQRSLDNYCDHEEIPRPPDLSFV